MASPFADDLAQFLKNRSARNPAQRAAGAPASAGTRRVVAPSPAPAYELPRTERTTTTFQPVGVVTRPTPEEPPSEPSSEPAAEPDAEPTSSTPAPDSAPAPVSTPEVTPQVDNTAELLAQQEKDRIARQNRQTYQTLAAFMQQIGLGGLLSVDQNGSPTGWLWQQIQDGVSSSAELAIKLRATPQFQERFPAIIELERQAGEGTFVGAVPTPSQVLEYETTVSQIFRNAGLPESFSNNRSNLQDLMVRGLDAEEVGSRVVDGFERIQDMPDDVREYFNGFWGIANSESALVGMILDPELTMRELEVSRRSAFAGGYARRYDIDLAYNQADIIAQNLPSTAEVIAAMERIGQYEPLFQESVGEAVDLQAGVQGLASEFGTELGMSMSEAEAQAMLERRLIERRSRQQGVTGGAAVTSAGVRGLGVN